MRAWPLLLALTTLGTGACTTVDMTSMGGSSASLVRTSSGPNVVEKATSRLFAVFSSNGWSTHDSRKRMQSAASILLNGLDDKSLAPDNHVYLDALTDQASLAGDMREANDLILNTVKAAEVFLAMSEGEDNLRVELADLEQALLASRQAEKLFATASERVGQPSEMAELSVSVDRLRDITDEFGRRVRRSQNRNVASVSGYKTAS